MVDMVAIVKRKFEKVSNKSFENNWYILTDLKY